VLEEVQRPTECSPLYKSYAAATAAVTLKTLSGIQFLFAIGNLFFFREKSDLAEPKNTWWCRLEN